jgi:hypothetical protein
VPKKSYFSKGNNANKFDVISYYQRGGGYKGIENDVSIMSDYSNNKEEFRDNLS